ncbi:MAG: FAD-dependent oxidoreductase [Burkholderiaceae bacterium]|nr:FAD-dependent oxidoreductase [Burkholderiaceae bacterium]
MSDVVVVGCGFAGFWSAVAARRVLGDGPTIVLVAPEPRLVIRPRLYQANPEALSVDVLVLLESIGVDFVRGAATGIDTSARTLRIAGDELAYRRLVIATGSTIRRPPIPGAEDAFTIDQWADAIAFDRRLRDMCATTARPKIAVVGAGFTGIELALELRDRVALHASAEVADQTSIVLIDRSPVVGEELGCGPRPEIERALHAARIDLMLSATVSSLHSKRIDFLGGRSIDVDLVVLTTGMTAAAFAASVPAERDALGRVHVDRTLQCGAAPDLFVTGDSAHVDTGDGHIALQSCQHAMTMGRFAGENAARSLLGMPLFPYSQLRYVTCLDLGRSGAVFTQGWDRAPVRSGLAAKQIKTQINNERIYPPAPGDPAALLLASALPADN